MPRYNLEKVDISQSVKKALRNVHFRRSFGKIHEPTLSNVKRLVKEWGLQQKFTPNVVENVASKLHFKTHKELTTGIKEITTKLRTSLGNKKYAIVVAGEIAMKSEHWILGPLLDGLQKQKVRPPTAIISSQTKSGISTLRRALENGVEAFVRVDDAAYSGMQSGEELMWLIENIDTISATYPIPYPIHIVIAFVFASDDAFRAIERTFQQYKEYPYEYFQNRRPATTYKPVLYRTSAIKSIFDVFSNKTLEALQLQHNNLTHGYLGATVLSHMVPNTQSFFSPKLGNRLAAIIKSPYRNYKPGSIKAGVKRKRNNN
jgi:hypothetical protein